jgi:hypothetical protein
VSNKSLVACALIVVAAGCASSSTPSGSASADVTPSTSRSTSRNRDLITLEDLNADPSLRAQSVIEVIRSMRPQYLINRGNNTMKDSASKANTDIDAGKVHASVDGGRIVEVSELTMTANDVLEIRYLNVAQANLKFGTAARQGPVILVTMKKQ